MTNIPNFIDKINETNSTNDKIDVLTSYKSDKLVQRVLKMAYCKVSYTYGVTMKNVKAGSSENTKNLVWGLDQLEKLNSRELTGNAAIGLVENVLEAMNEADRIVIERILDRDLKINVGRTNINKVMKGLIVKPCYMRCDIGTSDKTVDGKLKKGTFRNIDFENGAVVNLKADGTYRECNIASEVNFSSRSGESYEYNTLSKSIKNADIENGYLVGEMTVILDDNLLEEVLPKLEKNDKKNGTNDAEELVINYNKSKENSVEFILKRSLGNGLLNSDKVPENNIVFDCWDFIIEEDYKLAGLKDKKNPPKQTYRERFDNLKSIISKINNPNVRVIEYKEVKSLPEAMEFVVEKMNQGLEGGILKDWDMVFKDGINKQQLKLKMIIDADVRCTGFIEGKKGTKREKTFGSMTFETDDGMIKGSVSGFNDDQLEDFNSRRDELIGKVIAVEFNDLTKARGSKTYSFSHPRFIEVRDDKNTTDDLARVQEMQEMAKNFKEY